MKVKSKHLYRVLDHDYERIPRKLKKAIFGKRMKRSKLRALLESVTTTEAEYDGHKYTKVEPFEFCPCCGCTLTHGGDNRAQYPEVWRTYYCLKCFFPVATEDNGPYTHCLQLAPPYKF